jgi:Ca2+-transporting ATPase
MVWCLNAHCLNSRSEMRSVFRTPLTNNPLLIVAVVGTQLLQLAVLIVPPLRDLLSLMALTPLEGIRLALAAILVLAVMEIYKLTGRAGGPAMPHPRSTIPR